jgi:PAS domain S-box-containing protein
MTRAAQQLFELAEHPIFVLDAARNRIHDANPAACRFLGYTHEQLIATPISAIHPAELQQISAWTRSGRETGHAWTTTFSCRHRSGAIMPTEIELLAPDDSGYVFCFVRDRSDHRAPAP